MRCRPRAALSSYTNEVISQLQLLRAITVGSMIPYTTPEMLGHSRMVPAYIHHQSIVMSHHEVSIIPRDVSYIYVQLTCFFFKCLYVYHTWCIWDRVYTVLQHLIVDHHCFNSCKMGPIPLETEGYLDQGFDSDPNPQ